MPPLSSSADATPVEQQILARMRRAGRGSVWHAGRLRGLAPRNTLDQALGRLAKKGVIRRIAHGLYVFPQQLPVVGEVPVKLASIIDALNDDQIVPLVPSGAYACYLLGLVPTPPAEVVLLSADTTRVIQLADVVIRIRPAAPRYLQCAGRTSGILIQALRYLGDALVNDDHVSILRQQLSSVSRKALLRDIESAPAWMHQWFRRIADE
ncbi:MAG: DUF6088 family protein [Roseiflexaceae bacterium]|jgi:hypothetical protein